MKLTVRAFLHDQWTTVPPVATADLTGQTVVVVGANTGLGFETSKHFARMNPGKLILACRSEERLSPIKEETGCESVELRLLDLARFSSVIAFADSFIKNNERLDILVANAAIMTSVYELTADGWEESLQINVLSTFLLPLLVAPVMVATSKNFVGSKPRIVIVTSELHYFAKVDEEVFSKPSPLRLMNSTEYCTQAKMGTIYFEEKLLTVFFTRALAELLKDTPIIVNTANPGFCKTALRRRFSLAGTIAARIGEMLLARTAEQGSRQLVWAAVGSAEDPDKLRGGYINLQKIDEPSDTVVGEAGKVRQDKLWLDLVEELSKVDGRVKEFVKEFS